MNCSSTYGVPGVGVKSRFSQDSSAGRATDKVRPAAAANTEHPVQVSRSAVTSVTLCTPLLPASNPAAVTSMPFRNPSVRNEPLARVNPSAVTPNVLDPVVSTSSVLACVRRASRIAA